ncbi:MAG: riboflavin synthase [Alkalimonas sp.]|nr:riboflavin synthase [Alkalimonas sp.]
MFTGIIAAVGRLRACKMAGQGLQVWIDCEALDMADVQLGDSIASNGVCLTVTAKTANGFQADLSAETLQRTLFSRYQPGQVINLEKALLATSRLGGHMVSGHVDGVVVIRSIQKASHSWDIWYEMPAELSRFIAEKGSVSIDGISLTVNELTADAFRLTIVPHTVQMTTLQQANVGMKMHLEVDLIARYLDRLQQAEQVQSSGVTASLLQSRGFI